MQNEPIQRFGPVASMLGILLLSLCAKPVSAQPPPPRFERDPFFQAIREVHIRLSPDRELNETLLKYKTVAAEINLSPDDLKQIEGWIRESIRSSMELRKDLTDSAATQEEMEAKITECQQPFDKNISELLHKANFKRLLGIYVQDRGFRAATNKEVAEIIGLPADELAALRVYRTKIWERLMDENRERMRDLIRDGDREKITELFETAEEKLNNALRAKLTIEQRGALEALEGPRFDFPPAERRDPFRPAPRGGRRGEEDGRGNDNKNKDKECCRAAKTHFCPLPS